MRVIYILLTVILSSAMGSCIKKEADETAHHHAHHHAHDDGDEDDSGEIRLSADAAARFALTTEVAATRRMTTVVKAGATVEESTEGSGIVSAPTAGIVTITKGLERGSRVGAGSVVATIDGTAMSGGDPNRIAKAELDAAYTELERMEALYADRLVTLGSYNSAKAAYERAKAAYSAKAATGKALAPMSGVITAFEAHTGEYVEAGRPIATVASAERLSVRAEVPVKLYRTVAAATDARVVFPADGHSLLLSEVGARRVGVGEAAGGMRGYVPVTFSVANDGTFTPGETLEIYIPGGAEREVLAVPAGALSEQQGTFFVYQKIDDDCYMKLPVKTGVNDGKYVEITEGLTGGEDIVATGVTAVRLAENSGAVPEGHTH